MDMTPAEREAERNRARSRERSKFIGPGQSLLAGLAGLVITGVLVGIDRYVKPATGMGRNVRVGAKAATGAALMLGGHAATSESPAAGFGSIGGGAVLVGSAVEDYYMLPADPPQGGNGAAGGTNPNFVAADAGAPLDRIYGPPRRTAAPRQQARAAAPPLRRGGGGGFGGR